MIENKKEIIAKNIAPMINDGDFVNLGVGIPTMVSNYVPDDRTIFLHAENGAAGLSGRLEYTGIFDNAEAFKKWENEHRGEECDPSAGHKDLLDAGSDPSLLMPGACCFDISMSFAMLRGGHLDMTVLGAMQVDQSGNLANWMIPGKKVTGMGGAMDILAGTKKVVAAMTITAADGSPKILKSCTLPLTAQSCVTKIVTEKCIISCRGGELIVEAVYPGIRKEEIISCCEAELRFSNSIKEMIT